ncbi:hypothetical protein RD792_003682 [Penstemon davidsonii]|uniref:Peroxidase n=1 Tax=Penstemon davidsonii TaxID=160366 RepID=A0ABR0DFD0_9LAMI|nr:hypothetical protein RD792_003682 [Penstemon davidsonii]
MNSKFAAVVLVLMSLICNIAMANKSSGKLRVGYYGYTCPNAEIIVRQAVNKAVSANPGIAAGLIRMHFHDCFVRGCDGSLLLDTVSGKPAAEKDNFANFPSLRGFEVIDEAKAQLEAACPGTVSCADILAFAARDSVLKAGWIGYDVPSGRRDGRVSLSSEVLANLPPPSFSATQLRDNFKRKGLSLDEMVTLSGAHSIDIEAHHAYKEEPITEGGGPLLTRGSDTILEFTTWIGLSPLTWLGPNSTSKASLLSGFNATFNQDPSLDPSFAEILKTKCPLSTTNDPVVNQDFQTPNRLDNKYYDNLKKHKGLFTSDQTLFDSPLTSKLVVNNVKYSAIWAKKFGAAMVHMGSIDVLTGRKGEIRRNCRLIN